MGYPQCPQMDLLGNKLIESYREMIDADIAASLDYHNRNNCVAQVQREMVEHRNTCMLCKRNMMSRTMKVIPATATKTA